VAELGKVAPEHRGRADIAFWRAVILSAAGKKDEAHAAAVFARRPGLSREETRLLDAASR
ncbi:MAG TPA: hypothetical protein VIO38_17800, partial [Rariglobus sp.]